MKYRNQAEMKTQKSVLYYEGMYEKKRQESVLHAWTCKLGVFLLKKIFRSRYEPM